MTSERHLSGAEPNAPRDDGLPPIEPDDITGLLVAGGRETRSGGVDKGLQTHDGMPLALHAMLRLAPQVKAVMVNANRHLAAYESMGVAVWPDALPDCEGPLAGWLAGLEHCDTPYLLTVPCDAPHFPADLARRLAEALSAAAADVAVATTLEAGIQQPQPLFCLLRATLLESLVAYLHSGRRDIAGWTVQQRCVQVPFANFRD